MNSNLKQFIDSCKSIDEVELMKIGKMHKALPHSEKDWNELAQYVHFGSGEQYRQWVKKKQLEEGSLPVKNLKGKVMGVSEDTEKELQTLYKERTKTRDVFNSYRGLLRDEARVEAFKEELGNAIKQLPKLAKVTPAKVNKGKCKKEAVLCLSDLHIGVQCDNFYNKYNADIARERLNTYLSKAIDYCKENKVDVLNILNLGDLIHGYIHTDSRIQNQVDVATQVMIAAEYVAEFLNQLQTAAPIVRYRSCSDNHSRMMANKNESIEEENFGRIIDWYLKDRLKNTKIQFCEDNLDYGLGKFELSNGKIVMFAHGHEDTVNQVVQHYTNANAGVRPDYIFLGHYHSTKLKSFGAAMVFINGSIVGTEQYAKGKRLFGQPEQTLVIFNNNDLVNHTIRVSK